MFMDLVDQYVKSINEGAVPTIRTAWENVVAIECQRLLKNSIQFYKDRMEAVLKNDILEDEDFTKNHSQIWLDTIKYFKSRSVGDDSDQYEIQLQQNVDDIYKQFRLSNEQKSQVQCEEVIDNLIKSLQRQVEEREISTPDQLNAVWSVVENNYIQQAKGPMRLRVLKKKFTKFFDFSRKVAEYMVERVEEEARQRIKQEQERYQKLETTFTDIDQKWQITQQTNNELSAKVNNTVQANISLNVELQGAREQSRQEKELLNEIKKRIEDELETKTGEIGNIKAEFSKLTNTIDGVYARFAKARTIYINSSQKLKFFLEQSNSVTPHPFHKLYDEVCLTLEFTKQGVVHKKSAKKVVGWQKRTLILQDNLLFYFKDNKPSPAETKGCVFLDGKVKVQTTPKAAFSKDNVFEITTGNRSFYFQADNDKERDSWIEALKRAMMYFEFCASEFNFDGKADDKLKSKVLSKKDK